MPTQTRSQDRQSAIVTEPAAALPVSLSDAKAHLVVEGEADNRQILEFIKGANDFVQLYTGRTLITQTYKYGMQGWPDVIELPHPPVSEIVEITYIDSAGDTQILAADQYILDQFCPYGKIYPAYGVSWPDLRDERNNIVVEYKAGYGDTSAAIPGDIKSALKLIIGEAYNNREITLVGVGVAAIEMPFGIYALLDRYRIMSV